MSRSNKAGRLQTRRLGGNVPGVSLDSGVAFIDLAPSVPVALFSTELGSPASPETAERVKKLCHTADIFEVTFQIHL